MAMLDELSLRIDVIVDLSCWNCNQGVFQIQRSVLGPSRCPNVVQTFPADAAREVCMELSRVELAGLRTEAQAQALKSRRLAGYLNLWQALGKL
jgi:hypothetical protein